MPSERNPRDTCSTSRTGWHKRRGALPYVTKPRRAGLYRMILGERISSVRRRGRRDPETGTEEVEEVEQNG